MRETDERDETGERREGMRERERESYDGEVHMCRCSVLPYVN